MNKIVSTKNRVFMSFWLVRPRRENNNLFTFGSKLESFNQNLTKFIFLINTRSHFTMFMQKEIDLEIVQGANFEFIESLKNNGTKFLLVFDDSCEKKL